QHDTCNQYFHPILRRILLKCHAAHRNLHSFPTRRSSDLLASRLLLTPVAKQPRVLNEAAIFKCIRCGKPLGTEKLIGSMLSQYPDRKSTRLNSSHVSISYAVFCLKKKKRPMIDHYYSFAR